MTAAERAEVRKIVEYIDALTARLDRFAEATADLRRDVDEVGDD